MTVEKDVSLHLLNLEEMDILQLASLIFDESCAPRLTEVMVGVAANFCCGEEGCSRLLKKDEPYTLLSALRLLGSTSDVPTLCELMRLIRLLLWHRINRTPNTTWASCPLLKLLCQEQYRSIFSFLLHNSLSDALISSVLELLSNFLFICLPETGLNVASLYSTEEVFDGLVGIAERKSKKLKKHLDEDEEKIMHLVITCLYAFIDTPGARLIQLSASKSDSKLESILLAYIEHEGRIESSEELTEEICDKVTRVIGLSQLLIPTMKLPTLLLTVGKLLALIYGETQQYSVSRSQSREDEEIFMSEADSETLKFLNAKSKRRKRKSTEVKEISKTPVSNPLVEDSGWLSPPARSVGTTTVIVNSESAVLGNRVTFTPDEVAKELENEKTNFNKLERKSREKSISISSMNTSDLKELKDQLEEFCYQLIAYWWSDSKDIEKKRYKKSQEVVIDVLDQCHAHEVFLILNAVRLRDSNLVPKLQEQILDSGSHQRLVALLAHMYQ
ncbi:hypothetical protein Anas_04266 [Armadillidium nasatum]|uniref:Uncharacterized protein n=1 Tax=Armadillidium nasatum TaxID=96803 RepID=A0A5N5T8J1_9CRUS|nr:hypothetical protein Anas_04266 [Armadillidium nasatum]